jgi:two-component system, chemotaxis family, protein-glutamate methylesterase/glutaminase
MRDTGLMPERAPASDIEVPPDAEPIVQRDLIVIGASAGGVEALQRLVTDFPAELPASVLVVLHLMTSGTSVLDSILARAGTLPVTQARDGERLQRGHIYVAPPGLHMLLRGPTIHLSAGPRENGHRPAIDPLFRSAARAYGARSIGVVLTGNLDDGTDGLRLIKERGGATVVQDPDDAAYGDMPQNAIDHVEPDRIVPLADMGRTLWELLDSPLNPTPSDGVEDPDRQQIDLVEVELGREPPEGDASLLTCPDCGGVLIERDEGRVIRFACRVGHAYSPESLVEQQGAALESALWHAMRTLEERADLLRRIGRRAQRRGARETEERLERRAARAAGQADEIRNTILRLRGPEDEAVAETG